MAVSATYWSERSYVRSCKQEPRSLALAASRPVTKPLGSEHRAGALEGPEPLPLTEPAKSYKRRRGRGAPTCRTDGAKTGCTGKELRDLGTAEDFDTVATSAQ